MIPTSDVTQRLLSRCPGVVTASARRRVAEALADAVALCRRRWPRFAIGRDEFERWLADKVPEEARSPTQIAASLAALHLEDLYLAFAALASDPEAVSQLRRAVAGEAAGALRGVPSHTIDDVTQDVVMRLLAPPGGKPRLEQYRGTARLGTWLRVIAVRDHQRIRGGERERPEDEIERLRPELVGLHEALGAVGERQDHRELFKRAFQDAFASLSVHERVLLRQHYGDGLAVSKIAAVQHRDRGTIARQIARARHELLETVIGRFRAELGVDSEVFQDIVRSIRSRLELSLSRLFAEVPSDFASP